MAILHTILNRYKKKPVSQPDEKTGARLPMQVAQSQAEPVASVLEIFCPYCASQNYVKRGTRQKKRERVQLYLCKDCQKTFTPGAIKGKHYPTRLILDAISLYNLGYSLEQSCKIVNEMHYELAKNQNSKGKSQNFKLESKSN